MDGNYGGTREMRMKTCDTVIFLDIPRRVCLYRILKRSLLYHGKNRPDMADGCKEKFDWEFIQWVWSYPKRGRANIMKELEGLEDKKVIILKSRREAEDLLTQAEQQNK